MKRYIVDEIHTTGKESEKRIKYELRSKGKFAGSDEKDYPGITEAQTAAHKHIEDFPETYQLSGEVKFFHFGF